MVDNMDSDISLRRQCDLFGLARSSWHYVPVEPTNDEIRERKMLLDAIDEIFTAHPFYGTRRLKVILKTEHHIFAGRDLIRGAMAELGLRAVYPGRDKNPNTSKKNDAHPVFPYLLKDLSVVRPNQVWGTDITYLRLEKGWAYLAAIIDWWSRYVIGWAISDHPDVDLCQMALSHALERSRTIPEIHNSDQGSTYTSNVYADRLLSLGIRVSMDGRGRCMDNIFTERLWRSVKYENVFLMSYATPSEATKGLNQYFTFYNDCRPHQSLDYKTPSQMYNQPIHNPMP